ncbi:igLON family member 5-like isoform X2 [Hippocampus zosterae]|uniref:igLON family member 5-like isoform X2 n=1 Tax=Hippocampus zosterae TaxID=109293 RepID=UPI00223E4FFD|nr:igLON family member 5-like isoform X2 [Hippocampus zosterae]
MKTIRWLPLVLGALQASAEFFHTKAGQETVIKCGLDNFATSLVWRRGSQLLFRVTSKTRMLQRGTSSIAMRSKQKQDTNLQISAVEEGDAGEFTCVVDNKETVHTLAVVLVSVDPLGNGLSPGSVAVLRCRVAGLPSEPWVEWSRPGDARRWDRGLARLEPVEASHAGKWQCVFHHDGSHYMEEIELSVKKMSMTTISPSAKGHPTPGPIMVALPKVGFWLVASGGSLLVLLLLILVLIMSCRIRRRKKRFLQMNARKPMSGRQYCQCRCPTAAVAPRRPDTTKKKKPPALPMC